MDMFETIDLRKGRSDGKLEKRSDDSLRIIKCGDQRVFVVDSYRKDLISAIRDKFGADVEIIPPRAASARLEELSRQPMDGTYLERPRPDVRTIYFQDGEFAPLPLWKAKVWQARRPWDVTVSTKVLESLIKTEPRIFNRPIMTWHIPRIRGCRNW